MVYISSSYTGIYCIYLFLTIIGFINAQCPPKFVQIHKYCYYFSKDAKSWTDSYFHCNDMKSTLAIIMNKKQDYRVVRYLRKSPLNAHWWIGATYDWKQNVWRWTPKGRKVKFNKFTQDVGTHSLQWHCGAYDFLSDFKWSPKKCTEKQHYICQKKTHGDNNQFSNDLPTIASPFSFINQTFTYVPLSQDGAMPGFLRKNPWKTKSKKSSNQSRPKVFCPKGYVHVKRSCFKFSKDKATWRDAYFNCDDENNATLATLNDKVEDKALRKALRRVSQDSADRWIGGFYDWEDMSWKWARNGKIIQHQYEDRETLRWHCLVWTPLDQDRWTSNTCVQEKLYICRTEGVLIQFPRNKYKSTSYQTRTK